MREAFSYIGVCSHVKDRGELPLFKQLFQYPSVQNALRYERESVVSQPVSDIGFATRGKGYPTRQRYFPLSANGHIIGYQ